MKLRKIKYLFKRILALDYKNMWKIVKKISKKEKKFKLAIFFDVILCGFKYQAGYYDYLEFEFYKLNKAQRKTFLTRGINNEIVRRYNNRQNFYLFDDKIEFNKKFSQFLNRDWLYLENFEQFEKFCENKDKFIAKPIDGVGGVGVEKYLLNSDTDLNAVFNELMEKKQLLLEEFVVQDKELSRLYDKSVNTIRMFSFLKGDKVYILNSILKIGNGGVIDNFSSGGMYTFLDENGTVIAPAIDQEDNVFEVHPITKVEIVGFTVPKFKEAVELIKEAAKVVEDVRYIGWDVAIGENGPVIIEGNSFPGVFQIKPSFNPKKEGILTVYREVMGI